MNIQYKLLILIKMEVQIQTQNHMKSFQKEEELASQCVQRQIILFDKNQMLPVLTATDLLNKIFQTLDSPRNYRNQRQRINSFIRTQTVETATTKCNCRKSKCLKLYCECFSQGSFCKDCNCSGCHNTEEFSEQRAKAIDEVLIRSSLPFGHQNSSIKGCNCKKTECQKKYCECFRWGQKCTQYCKCESCLNI